MYRLYGAPQRASAAPEAVLEELEVSYEYVHLEPEAARSDRGYLRLNPMGQIPTLVDGEQVICEAGAICLYLCDRNPDARLAPANDSPLRGLHYQWMLFLSNTLQPAYMLNYYPERYYGIAEGSQRLASEAAERIQKLWALIDRSPASGPYLLGEHFSVSDLYLHMLGTWHEPHLESLASLVHVTRHAELMSARPAVRRMLDRNFGPSFRGW